MSDRVYQLLGMATPGLHRRGTPATRDHRPRRNVWGLILAALLLLTLRFSSAAQVPASQAVFFASAEQITDQVLFTDTKDNTKRSYVPRYRLAEQTVSGDQQYRVHFSRQGTTANLEVYLEKYPAPELGDAVRAAQELPHRVEVLLRYDLPTKAGSGQASAYKELVFQEVTRERNGLKAVLRLDDLRERDALIHALEDPTLDATLLVQRTFTVLARPLKEIAAAQARIDKVDEQVKNLAKLHEECDPILRKWGKEGPGPSAPYKEQVGFVFCYQQLTPQIFRGEELKRERARLEEELQKLRKQTGPVTVTLDNRQPFSFDRTRHPYVFAGVNPDPGSKPQLVRRQLPWQGRYYSYFRPADQTDLWYYLPDRFVLAEDKQVPRLSVKFSGPPEAQSVELEYVAVPLTQSDRLKVAEAELRPTTASKVTLEPLLVDEAQLWVALPSGGGEGSYQQRRGASVDLRDGLKDQLRLTLDEFQQIYAALFSNSFLLTGEVRLDLGGSTRERIPFEARVTQQSPEALWDKLISHAVFADYQKTIQVKTSATVFGKDVKALLVTFQEGGTTVELRQDKLEAVVTVRLPLREFILNTEQSGEYHYKVTAIRENGTTNKTGMWKTDTATILYPEVP